MGFLAGPIGRLKAVVHKATDRAWSIVLSPCDSASGCTDGSTVLDVLCRRHPNLHPPVPATLLHGDVFSHLKKFRLQVAMYC